MTQTSGELWGRLRRPLLDAESRFAWAAPLFEDLRLRVEGRDQPLEKLFARILFNDAERQVLAVGFSETPPSRAACDVLVKVERVETGIRLEVALCGRLAKELRLDEQPLAAYPGAGETSAGNLQGPFASVAVMHV